jgi:heterodisulfide reductase subunit A-like polyferredoxin
MYIIDAKKCQGCYQCIDECKFEAIKPVTVGKYCDVQINQELCKKCGSCKEICPGEAISDN